jgi:hypothetical protein
MHGAPYNLNPTQMEWLRSSSNFAANMLAKHGHVPGTGLGKNGQGIPSPIVPSYHRGPQDMSGLGVGRCHFCQGTHTSSDCPTLKPNYRNNASSFSSSSSSSSSSSPNKKLTKNQKKQQKKERKVMKNKTKKQKRREKANKNKNRIKQRKELVSYRKLVNKKSREDQLSKAQLANKKNREAQLAQNKLKKAKVLNTR